MDGWMEEREDEMMMVVVWSNTARAVDDTTMTFVVGNNGTHPPTPSNPSALDRHPHSLNSQNPKQTL
jgi:hypothetical protein